MQLDVPGVESSTEGWYGASTVYNYSISMQARKPIRRRISRRLVKRQLPRRVGRPAAERAIALPAARGSHQFVGKVHCRAVNLSFKIRLLEQV